MVKTRTPFRISFFGGGTDYPTWYEENGGAVLSTTIDKYCYVLTRYLPPFFDYKHRIRYTLREETKTIDEIKHPSVKECLKFLKIQKGIEMVHISDLPAMSGLGSSSAFTVGFLNSLYALTGRIATKRQLALEAIHVEQNLIKEAVGSQDQTAAAFGGFNKIEFGGQQKISVCPITLSPTRLKSLQDHLMLYFTGFSRLASEIAVRQIKNIHTKTAELRRMRETVDEAAGILTAGNLDDFGGLLHEAWQIKRGLASGITNSFLDSVYERATQAGALGGKILGAGGGGFILFFVKPEKQGQVKEALKDLLYIPFNFENLGSQITYYAPSNDF